MRVLQNRYAQDARAAPKGQGIPRGDYIVILLGGRIDLSMGGNLVGQRATEGDGMGRMRDATRGTSQNISADRPASGASLQFGETFTREAEGRFDLSEQARYTVSVFVHNQSKYGKCPTFGRWVLPIAQLSPSGAYHHAPERPRYVRS